MSDEYQKYEEECRKVRKHNEELLMNFNNWLTTKNLAEKTIRQHMSNVGFFINTFLLYSDVIEAKDGIDQVGEFLGYWFIRKAMWASVTAIKENAASLKKFYKFMQEKGLVDKEDLQSLLDTVREEMPEWLSTLERYDDPSIDDPFDIWE
jgi:site-specific recombinase XerD